MAINIKNREVEDLLGELKVATGQGTTEIIRDLLRKAVDEKRRRDQRRRAYRNGILDQICREVRAKEVNAHLTDEELIGYDEDGLPT